MTTLKELTLPWNVKSDEDYEEYMKKLHDRTPNFNIFGKPPPPITHTMGLRLKVPEENVEWKQLYEHLTIASMSDADQDRLDVSLMMKFPNRGTIAGEAVLGKNNDIHVWVVRFHPEDEIEIKAAKKLFEKYNIPEYGNPMTNYFFPHITKKVGSPLQLGSKLEFDHIFIKKIGKDREGKPVDPHFVLRKVPDVDKRFETGNVYRVPPSRE